MNQGVDFSGSPITGSGSLTQAGAGTLTLNADNNYTGATNINGGTLTGNTIAHAGSNSAFGAGSSFALSNAGTLQYGGTDASTNRTLTLNSGGGVLDVANPTRTLTWLGDIAGSNGLTKTGAGTLWLQGSKTLTGAFAIYGGVASGDQMNSFGLASTIDIRNAATLQYRGGTFTASRTFSFGNNGGTIEITNPATTLTLDGSVTGSGFEKTGPGTLALSGNNSFTSSVTISGGTLSGNSIANIGLNSAFGAGTSISVSNGATLQYTGGVSGSTNRDLAIGGGGGAIDIQAPGSGTVLTWNGLECGRDDIIL